MAGGIANSVVAQEKAAQAADKPTVLRVLLENDRVRVYEARFKPGDENPTVPTSATRIVRVMKGGTLQRTYADGKKETVVYKTGEVRVSEPGPAYTNKNIGKTEVHPYVVQLK
jgi:hypothetical protein